MTAGSIKTSVNFYHTTWHHNPGHNMLLSRYIGNFIPHITMKAQCLISLTNTTPVEKKLNGYE